MLVVEVDVVSLDIYGMVVSYEELTIDATDTLSVRWPIGGFRLGSQPQFDSTVYTLH